MTSARWKPHDYDLLGRQTQDRVTALDTGVDGSVRRIATAYDVLSRRETLTSFDDPDVGEGTVLNQCQFAYNDFSQLVSEYQSHAGSVNTMTTPRIEYAFADGSDNTVRPTGITYPNGRELTYAYGTTDGIDDAASRIASIIDDDSTHLADYSYLGLGTFVIQDDTEPELKWTLVDLAGSNDPDTGDIYSGFDRFGRVKDNRWYDYGSSADVDRIQYGYDRASNRIWRKNVVADSLGKHFDELYSYDLVHRLKDMQRGTLNGTETAVTDKTFAQCWMLDPTGNWTGFREDDDGDDTWDLEQEREANSVNEITDVSETVGPSWVTPAYSRAGNITIVPQPADTTQSYTATYDAWNRLVKIATGTDTVGEYVYDGVKRRIVRKAYSAGVLSETRRMYHTKPHKWQVVEERTGSSTDAERQFVWGLRYIDDIIVRDRDTNVNGTLDERVYACQDPQWNVTTLADAAGDVEERYAYSAYGTPTFLTAAFSSSTPGYRWETLYSGYRFDDLSGLLYVRNRVYHSTLGSWIQRDPAEYIESASLYEYAKSNPVAHTDPLGLQSSVHPPGTVIVITPGGEQKIFPPGTNQGVVDGFINGHPNSRVIVVPPEGKITPEPELKPFMPQPPKPLPKPLPEPEPEPELTECEQACKDEYDECWLQASTIFLFCAWAFGGTGAGFIACSVAYLSMVDDCKDDGYDCLEDCPGEC